MTEGSFMRSRQTQAFLAGVISGIVLLFSFSGTAADVRYVDKANGFSIDLPKGWEQQKDSMGAVIIAISPLENPSDKFRENMNVVIEQLKNPMTTPEYFKASQGVIKKVFNEYKLEKTGTAKVDNQDFSYSIFLHRLGQIRARVLQYVAVYNKKAFVITCSAEPDRFNAYRERFESAIKSFKFETLQTRQVTGGKGIKGK